MVKWVFIVSIPSTMLNSLCWLMVDCREPFSFYAVLQFSVTHQWLWALANVRVIYSMGFSSPCMMRHWTTLIRSSHFAWRQELVKNIVNSGCSPNQFFSNSTSLKFTGFSTRFFPTTQSSTRSLDFRK